jgi:hypothetical protein
MANRSETSGPIRHRPRQKRESARPPEQSITARPPRPQTRQNRDPSPGIDLTPPPDHATASDRAKSAPHLRRCASDADLNHPGGRPALRCRPVLRCRPARPRPASPASPARGGYEYLRRGGRRASGPDAGGLGYSGRCRPPALVFSRRASARSRGWAGPGRRHRRRGRRRSGPRGAGGWRRTRHGRPRRRRPR